jgi:hypothetical protein
MCRKPIPPESDEERHHQNRQVVEYAGEPIHRDCHPTSMPEPDTDHVEVHEHLTAAHRKMCAAADACEDDGDMEAIVDVHHDLRMLIRQYERENL